MVSDVLRYEKFVKTDDRKLEFPWPGSREQTLLASWDPSLRTIPIFFFEILIVYRCINVQMQGNRVQ